MSNLISDLQQVEQQSRLTEPASKGEVINILKPIVSQSNATAFYLNALVEYLAVKGMRLCEDGRVRLDVKELNEYLQAAKLVIQKGIRQ